MEPNTPLSPLEPGVEMFTKGRPQSLFALDMTLANGLSVIPELPSPSSLSSPDQSFSAPFSIASGLYGTQKARPVSHITEIDALSEFGDDQQYLEYQQYDDYVEYEEGSEGHESEFEEEIENRKSQTTLSTWDEISTPRSLYRPAIPDFDFYQRQSVEGPKGPHLFRTSSSTSSDFAFEQALQMSPLTPHFHKSGHVLSPGHDQYYSIDDAFDAETPVTTIDEAAYRLPHLGKKWQRENPREWTTQQVCVWMEDSGVETEYVDLFVANDISGNVLLDLQFADLKDLGIQSFGKRHQIWNHITALKDQAEQDDFEQTPKDEKRSSDSRLPEKRSSQRSNASKQSVDSCEDIETAPTGKRRRRKVRDNGYEPIAPADSVSIIAIEQYIPKPHVCKRGDNCEKAKQQKRLLAKLSEELEFPISPQAGGRIYMVGNPGSTTAAQKVKEAVRNVTSNKARLSEEKNENVLSMIQPSVVASSDLLGPGEMPDFALDPDRLRQLEERDPQDNVMAFLAFQQYEPPMEPTPMSPTVADPEQMQDPWQAIPEIKLPEQTSAPLQNLSKLPRLQIPAQVVPLQHFSSPGPAHEDMFSPLSACRTAIDTPLGANLLRFGTPASEMDVPVTHVDLGPVARETSQSVPPNMQYRDPIQRSASRPVDWKRPSFQLAPVKEEEPAFEPLDSEAPQEIIISQIDLQPVETHSQRPSPPPSPGSMKSGRAPGLQTHRAGSQISLASSISSQQYATNLKLGSQTSLGSHDPRFSTSVTHSGWMKKKRTRLLRHEWTEHHFRLNNGAQLTMHKNDMPEASPLEKLNIDEYAVGCSSLGSNKLSAKLKALKIQGNAEKEGDGDYAFSFQLVPSKSENKTAIGMKKTHHFAVKSKEERIDWMRELMLAKALREKEAKGYEIMEVVRAEKDAVGQYDG